jgi:hypothetical protein
LIILGEKPNCYVSNIIIIMSNTPAKPSPASETNDLSTTPKPTGHKYGKGKSGKKDAKTSPPANPNVPLGSIPVPPPKTAPAKTPSKVVSTAVEITGWGDADFTSMHKREPLLEQEPDASGFFDLVDAVYHDLVARQTSMKFVPFSLFRYLCGQLWWYRVLYVHKSNGFVLDSQQKRFLDTIGALEDLVLPDKIAQYLANLGNFDYNGEVYRMKLPTISFDKSREFEGVSIPGQLNTQSPTPTPTEFWFWSQLPIPASLLTTVLNEQLFNAPGTTTEPYPTGTGYPEIKDCTLVSTENICGYLRTGWQASHSSWVSTFAHLGWSLTSFPRDLQTTYQSSPSTLSWVSSRLSLLSSEKMISVKQLSLTKQGNFCQIGYLDTHGNDLRTRKSFGTLAEVKDYRYTTSQPFHLVARSALPPALLSATFCFGYRFRRYAFEDSKYTNSSPFVYYNKTTKEIAPLPDGYMAQMNRTLDALPPDLIAARYMTFAQERSTVLVSALL